ncbi:ATP-binding protein [Flocculibacter collagenilyticus]|uniref:ATP-binding protein n=1 Tax=Flocculibacter collagenilyticus TaxID=2744479 RepID=UPI0018F740AD|nr:ATP-binding protein [Flocculibacter collagenilyticus]
MQLTSLSKKLLTNVLSVYFILTLVVTCGQIFAEYFNTKNHISGELNTLQKTFSGSLTRAIWELNEQQALTIAEGLLAIPMIEGVVVRDDNGVVMWQLGRTLETEYYSSKSLANEGVTLEDPTSGLFGYTFPLIFEFSERATLVGDVSLFSSRDIVVDRILVSIYFMIGNAMIKTTFLILLFLLAFRRLLTEPLKEITGQIEELEMDHLEGTQLVVHTDEYNELKIIEQAFNKLIGKVLEYKDDLESTQRKLLQSNEQLDQQNITLEQEVARKTSTLSQAMMDLQQQKFELEKNQKDLHSEIDLRSKRENELTDKQAELEKTVEDLKRAQDRLVQSEKMAALGGLVAGITHDVNTPVGIGVTATSYLDERLQVIDREFKDKKLTAVQMEAFIDDAKQSVQLLSTNLQRASELIASFKQIAVDQTSEAVRMINMKQYVEEIIRSLRPKLKKTKHHITLNCPEKLQLSLPAGAISQIFTNLILNSLIHGFEGKEEGRIEIEIAEINEHIEIKYTDDGNGLNPKQLSKLFDPFFTTKREQGGSGLGTHIIYNLVRQSLNGEITAESEPKKGLTYHIIIPKKQN